MFKKTVNIMKLKVTITPQTPLLVASGKTFDVTRPDIQFMRVNTDIGETIYVPGSSLKGVLRGGMETVLGENPVHGSKICITSETMCHDLHKAKKDSRKKLPYKHHCPVCRMFGSGDMASRLVISDVFPFDLEDSDHRKEERIKKIETLLTSRSGNRIDRKTGKTSPGALFEYEILGGGELFAEFTFTNYELYQPGLLFLLFELSNEGFLRYGHSKSRGLGVLNFDVSSIKILQMGRAGEKKIRGIGSAKETGNYGFYSKADVLEKEFPGEDHLLYTTFHFTSREDVHEVIGQLKSRIRGFLEGVS